MLGTIPVLWQVCHPRPKAQSLCPSEWVLGCLLPCTLRCLQWPLYSPSKVQTSWHFTSRHFSLHSLAVSYKISSLPHQRSKDIHSTRALQHTVLPNCPSPQLAGSTTGMCHNVAPGWPWTYKHLRLVLSFWSFDISLAAPELQVSTTPTQLHFVDVLK